ncbi:polyubiquitin-B-like [Chironomus tepperi]|uniref:polyubiquitin-B-like n=1 Tax=Chironomus tepperi TaxID=113505 RepID=UPI00391F1C7B
MFDGEFLIGAKFDKNASVADFIKQYKGSQADCFDLIVNNKVIPKHFEMRTAIEMNFRERQVEFYVYLEDESTIAVKFGLSKTIKSVKDYLHDVKKVDVDQHRMTLNGKSLNDEATLNDCKVVNGSVLVLEPIQDGTDMTVYDLIKIWKNSDADYYDLVADGKVVGRHKTLLRANIYRKSKLELQERMISFKVNLINYPPIRINFLPSKTILELKEHLSTVEFIPVSDQVLVLDTLVLDDDLSLQDYEIKNESEILLIIRLHGG